MNCDIKRHPIPRRATGVSFQISVLLCMSLLASPVMSATWICGNENWNTNYWNYTCWDGWDYPDPGEDVYLVDTIYAYEKTVNYVNPSYNPVLNNLYIESTGGKTTTLNINQDTLTTSNTYVGIVSGGSGAITQGGGTHTVNNNLVLGSGVGSKGSYVLSGTGVLTVNNDVALGYYGSADFTQSAGSHTVDGLLTLGYQEYTKGGYSLSGGTLSVSKETIGFHGRGEFGQTGGSHTIANDFYVGFFERGIYSLSSGSLTAGREVIYYHGFFEQSGGTHVADTINIHGDPSVLGGLFSMSGGALTAKSITNDGRFDYTGGTITADVTNTASFNMSGTGSRIITGDVINEASGTINVNNTTVAYTGKLTNKGAYLSDSSNNNFTDLEVTESGYLIAGTGDSFIISEDFINQSSEQLLWDTVNASIIFTSGSDDSHEMYIPGLDFGVTTTGYLDNFAWDTLSIESGNSLSLFDGDALAGGALYLSALLGVDFSGSQVNNIFGINGLNVYYDALDDDSIYLGGLTFDLMDGGQLIPLNSPAVPIPPSAWLFASGLIGLVGIARSKSVIN